MYFKKLALFMLIGGLLHNVESICYSADILTYDGQSHVCMSITEFKLLSENIIPAEATQFTCPNQMVCVHEPEICADPTKMRAECDKSSKCKVCSSNTIYACVSATEFVPCNKGALLSAIVQKCPPSKYCGFSANHLEGAYPCVTDAAEQACLETTTMTTTSSTATACKGPTGANAVTTDTTCKSYFYCSSTNGVTSRVDYMCPGDYIFNPNTKKCVSKRQYTCPNTASG